MQALVERLACGLDGRIHVADPLIIIVDEDVRIADVVDVVLVDATGIVQDVVDLRVSDVACRSCAWTLFRI